MRPYYNIRITSVLILSVFILILCVLCTILKRDLCSVVKQSSVIKPPDNVMKHIKY
jgi:hypothetical protein